MPSPDSAEIMKVSEKRSRSLAAFASASNFSRGTRSILFSTRIFGCATASSFAKIASASASIPALASSSTQTTSASCAPLQAVNTMARSSRRFGAKMPGVSTRTICALSSITMPRISARVVCTLRETIVTLEPTSALTSVDLPTLGAPISATKPQRVVRDAPCASVSSVMAARRLRARSSRMPPPSRPRACCRRGLRPAPAPANRRRRGTADRGAARCARPRDRPASAIPCSAPIPAARSLDRAAAAASLRIRSVQLRSTNCAAAE